MAKGFTDKKGNFRPTGKNGSKSTREKSIEPEGKPIEQRSLSELQLASKSLGTIIEETEKDFENGLKESDFENKKLRDKNWNVGINYEGGFSEEYFSFWAQPNDESFEPVSIRSFISNSDWSEGLDEDIQKRIEADSDFGSEEYDKWLASTFELFADNFFMELQEAIEDEFR